MQQMGKSEMWLSGRQGDFVSLKMEGWWEHECRQPWGAERLLADSQQGNWGLSPANNLNEPLRDSPPDPAGKGPGRLRLGLMRPGAEKPNKPTPSDPQNSERLIYIVSSFYVCDKLLEQLQRTNLAHDMPEQGRTVTHPLPHHELPSGQQGFRNLVLQPPNYFFQ